MPVSDLLQRVFGSPPSHHTTFIIGTSVGTALAVLAVARLALHSTPSQTISSPRETQLPRLSKEEQAALPYPPDVFPGARDVGSPVYPRLFTLRETMKRFSFHCDTYLMI